ncbi:hypothetical protein HMPREF1989_00809 [Porphyromonas gingivalis F0566]|nr:hypothetical protein HMPREF1989_00809 [Porphyromonas gingivalis F0566]
MGAFVLSPPESDFFSLRFIYKSKTIYIFIVNDLYINRYLLSKSHVST